MRKAIPQSLLCAFVAVVMLATIAYARPELGVLDGIVVNPKGAPVGSAHVYLQTADGTGPRTVHTNPDGHFRFGELPAGIYQLRAQIPGMTSDWERNVVIKPGKSANVTLRLLPKLTPKSEPQRIH